MTLAAEASAGHPTAVLLIELGAILLALGVLGRIARAVHLPVVPLYLLGGLAFGQGGILELKASREFLDVAANIGVILLLVMLGLEYSARDLVSSLRRQAPVGVLDGVLNAVPGAAMALIAGWDVGAVVALAGITWVSSSGVIAKNLADSGRMANAESSVILGVLVIEDLAMAVYLPVLTALLAHRSGVAVGLSVAVAVLTVGMVLFAAARFGPTITRLVSAKDAESLLLGVLGLTVLVAGLAEQFKVSAAVGAFLVGVALSGTVAESAAELLTPIRDVFAAAFFVVFGLSTRPGSLVPALPLALLLTVVCIGTKIVTGYLAARRARLPQPGRWRAAVTLVPRGEFSVVVASLAVAAGAEEKLGPLTACFVLLTISIGALIHGLPDRLDRDSAAPPALG